MIDLELNAADKEIIGLARTQSANFRKTATKVDRLVDFESVSPAEWYGIPEEKAFVHVRNLARERAHETSGTTILDSLIHLEEYWGLRPLYFQGHGSDTLRFTLSDKLLERIGTPDQCQRWKDVFMVWGMSEPSAGSDTASMRTTAIWDAATSEWVLNGEKTFISFGQVAEAVLVLARFKGPDDREGIAPFILPKGTPGFDVGPPMDKLGLRSQDTVSLAFTDCRIPADNILAGDLKSALAIFNTTRATVAMQAAGFSRAALDLTREFLENDGLKLDYSEGLQSRPAVLDRFLNLEGLYEATLLTGLHAKWHEQTYGPAKFYPAVAKAKAGTAVRHIVSECMQIVGPQAAEVSVLLERILRDSRILDIYEGPGEVQRLLIAREILGYNAKELN